MLLRMDIGLPCGKYVVAPTEGLLTLLLAARDACPLQYHKCGGHGALETFPRAYADEGLDLTC